MMMKIWRQYKNTILVIAGICVLGGAACWAVLTKPVVHIKKQDLSAAKIMEYTGNTIKEEKNGKLVWELKAKHIKVNSVDKIAKLQIVSGEYHSPQGVLIIKADNGTYNQQNQNISLQGKVVVLGKDMHLEADKFQWQADKSILIGVGNVKITYKNMLATGEKIESENSFSDFKLSGNAHIVKEE